MRFVKQKGNYSLIMVLVLFCVFTFVFLLLVSVGGGVYKNTVRKTDESYQIRTAFSYISNKVRYADSKGVQLLQKNGENILAIADDTTNGDYVTYVYFFDGSLKELYQKKGKDIQMNFGEEILETGWVDMRMDENILRIDLTTSNGTKESIAIFLPDQGGKPA